MTEAPRVNIEATGQPYPYNAGLSLGPLPMDSWRDPARTGPTLAAMAALVRSCKRTGWVYQLTRAVVGGRHLPAFAPARAADGGQIGTGLLAVYWFLHQHMKHVPDPEGQEYVRHPDQLVHAWETNGKMEGDCDDRAVLGAAMVVALGYPAKFVAIGPRPDGPFSHVYYAAVVRRQLVPFDPQENVTPGQELPHGRKLISDT